jgi:hypothetical protein
LPSNRINAQGGGYGNALYAAAAGGHETVVRLLLENGTDIDEKVAPLLLEKGADIKRSGYSLRNANRGMTALHLAALSRVIFPSLQTVTLWWGQLVIFTPLRAWAMIVSFCRRDSKNNKQQQTDNKQVL